MKTDIRLDGAHFRVRTPYAPALVSRFQTIPGRTFDGAAKEWVFPAVKDVLLMVCDACGILPMMLPDDLKEIAGRDGYQAFQRVALDMSVVEGHQFLTQPYEHQRANLAHLTQNDRWLLADEQGTGKTHAVVNRVLSILRDMSPPLKNVLVVCPKSVMTGWVNQMREHGRVNCHEAANGLTNPHAYVNVVNYERVRIDLHEILKYDWCLIVLDEIHRVKNFTSLTCKAIRKLTAKAPRVFGLSGTPAPNGLEDWFGVLSALDPWLLPCQTKTAFEARYCVKSQLPNGGWKVSGYRNVQELHGFIASVTSRVTKAEALDLPPKIFSTRTVTLAGEQQRVYRELKKDAVARLNATWKIREASGVRIVPLDGPPYEEVAQLTVRNVLTESLRLLQVVGGFVPDDDENMHEIEDKAKVDALEELIEEVGPKQVVIWCAFQAEVSFLVKWLQEKYGEEEEVSICSSLTGLSTATERQQALDDFAAGRTRYFVATASAGGTGVNGLQVADTAVYYSRDWNYATWAQSQDRTHRIGSMRPVSIITLTAAGTVDERVDEALRRKADLQEMLLKNPEDIL